MNKKTTEQQTKSDSEQPEYRDFAKKLRGERQ